MDALAFLASIGAALPGKHCAFEPGVVSGATGFVQAPIAIAQQRSCQHRHAQRQIGKDEQLVPHDMAAIGFTMPAALRHADVHIDRMG